MNERKKKLQIAFLQGALLGPIAVFPASLVLFVVVSLPAFSLSAVLDGLLSSVFVGIWGTCVAYVFTFTYGTLLWFILLKIGQLNLIGLLLGSLVPTLFVGFNTQSIGLTLGFAYYSLAVSFFCWFLGLRHVQSQL
ncbi:MAG: hypothetical protein ACRBBW_08530 [Cellvibrionaceae bacterium]